MEIAGAPKDCEAGSVKTCHRQKSKEGGRGESITTTVGTSSSTKHTPAQNVDIGDDDKDI